MKKVILGLSALTAFLLIFASTAQAVYTNGYASVAMGIAPIIQPGKGLPITAHVGDTATAVPFVYNLASTQQRFGVDMTYIPDCGATVLISHVVVDVNAGDYYAPATGDAFTVPAIDPCNTTARAHWQITATTLTPGATVELAGIRNTLSVNLVP